ncbi:MAG: helix-hairpin-helix domain-containing protein [Candidatus Manganitrophus sp.]|nr:MAG: helix-hairpin-helix domain-containing protein [Candidatus Manganitrophus sp.]
MNAVGVDVNTASAPLLARISGLNDTPAANIVAYRDENGAFRGRRQLLDVPRLGPKTFEQGGRLSAHHERRQPARCLRGPPGGLSGGGAHPRRHRPRAARGDRQQTVLIGAVGARNSPTNASACRR